MLCLCAAHAGFIGYVSEFAVMFIWDQCFLLGGKAKDWRRLLPVVILTLLKVGYSWNTSTVNDSSTVNDVLCDDAKLLKDSASCADTERRDTEGKQCGRHLSCAYSRIQEDTHQSEAHRHITINAISDKY